MNNPKRKLRRFHLQQKALILLIESKRIKYLGINLAWEIQGFYTENENSYWKELKKI